jgi:urease accessory protein
MTTIRKRLDSVDFTLRLVDLPVERRTLAKHRWRGVAKDGAEFGFDLEKPLADGEPFHQAGSALYVIVQQTEPVLELRLSDCEIRGDGDTARIGWLIGARRFPMQITQEVIRVPDVPALRELFDQEHLPFVVIERVFSPSVEEHQH